MADLCFGYEVNKQINLHFNGTFPIHTLKKTVQTKDVVVVLSSVVSQNAWVFRISVFPTATYLEVYALNKTSTIIKIYIYIYKYIITFLYNL